MPKPKILESGAVIGFLGGGQLGRMLAVAATQLGFKTHCYAPEPQPSAAFTTSFHTCANYDDKTQLEQFARAVNVISFEFENIPLATAQFLSAQQTFLPPPDILAIAQDRLEEKKFLNKLGIETAPWTNRGTGGERKEGFKEDSLTSSVIVKTRRLGYDGKGQIRADSLDAITKARAKLAAPTIIEAVIPFDREIALCAARDQQGQIAFYDCVETHHQSGILRKVQAPARITPALEQDAHTIAKKILKAVDYVGILAVEMFEVKGRLLVNEIAPRVHNSGHWTIDACVTSQFTQHIRAIAGWPLGSTKRIANAEMINLIGADAHPKNWQKWLNRPHTTIHLYDKGKARPGRKMGHITQIFPHASSQN